MICHRTLSLLRLGVDYDPARVSQEEAAKLRATTGPQACLGSNCAMWVADIIVTAGVQDTNHGWGRCGDNPKGRIFADSAAARPICNQVDKTFPTPTGPAVDRSPAHANPQVGDTYIPYGLADGFYRVATNAGGISGAELAGWRFKVQNGNVWGLSTWQGSTDYRTRGIPVAEWAKTNPNAVIVDDTSHVGVPEAVLDSDWASDDPSPVNPADWVGKRVHVHTGGNGTVTAVTSENSLEIEIDRKPGATCTKIYRWPQEVTRLTSVISEANTRFEAIDRTAPVSATHSEGGVSSPAECTAIRQQLGPLLSIPNEPESAAVMVRRFVNKTDGYTSGVREYGRVPNASPDWLEGYEEGTDDRAALVAARRQNQGSAASKADLDAARLALGNSAVWVDGVVDVAKSIEAILVRSAARIDREEAATLAATLPLGDNWEKDALAGAKHAQRLIAAALRPSPEGGTGANRG